MAAVQEQLQYYSARKGVMSFFFPKIGFPSGEFSEVVKKFGNALLNSKGGLLVFGVAEENGKIIGIDIINRQQEDLFKLALDRQMKMFNPSVNPNLYRFNLKKVGYRKYMIEIRISAAPIGELYENGEQEVFIVKNRKIRGPLWPQELKDLIIEKYKEEIAATKGILSP